MIIIIFSCIKYLFQWACIDIFLSICLKLVFKCDDISFEKYIINNHGVIWFIIFILQTLYQNEFELITRIGCMISIFSLVLTIIVLIMVIKDKESDPLKTVKNTNIIHLNLCSCLLAATVSLYYFLSVLSLCKCEYHAPCT